MGKNNDSPGVALLRVCVAGFCAAGLLAAAGCSAGRGFAAGMAADAAMESAYAKSVADASALEEFSAAEADDGGAEPGTEVPQSRKLVKSASLRVRVPDPNVLEGRIAETLGRYGAYASQAAVYENSRSYTIRVPELSYGFLLEEINGLGKVLYRSENAEDVTLRYYDLAGRLATREELLKTYRTYLGKAQNIEEILSVEARITELQYEIDRTGTQFRSLANLVDYATIELELVGPVAVSSSAGPSLGERITALFGSFGAYASMALLALMSILIYGIPGIGILALLFWLFFGRVGLLKKLWFLVMGRTGPVKTREAQNTEGGKEGSDECHCE
ncbi:MAG: DUF4349 domain-containing protein [Treponema sp.]|nr:DUF4349 domain-containing protein [Treponema sp.]